MVDNTKPAELDGSVQKLNERLELSQRQILAYSRDFAMVYRKERERRINLEEMNQKLRATLDSISDAVVTTDGDFMIQDLNIAFGKLVNAPIEDLKSNSLLDTLELTPHLEKIQKLNSDGSHNVNFEIAWNTGSGQSLTATVTRIGMRQDERKGFVFVFRDVTEQKRMERLKERLFIFASNEIRAPLNGLTGFLKYLYEDFQHKLAAEELAHFKFLIESGENLENIVEDLMKLSPLNQASDPQTKPVTLSKIVRMAIGNVEPDAHSIGVGLQLKTHVRGVLFVDEILLLKAFESILRNMVYCCSEGTRIELTMQKDEKRLKIVLNPSGNVRQYSNLEKVLQTHDNSEEEIGLQGINLALARDIIEWNGGEISITRNGKFSLAIIFHDWRIQ